MATFSIKEGDTSPSISYTLSPETVILTGATVVFNMVDRAGVAKISRGSCSITDNGDGTATGTPTVQYNWTADDTDTAGLYRAEFEVTYSDSTVETFPNSDFIAVNVTKDLA